MTSDEAESNIADETRPIEAEVVEIIPPIDIAFELHGATLSGGLKEAMLDTIRHHMGASWHNLLGHQQKALKADLDRVSCELVRKTVDIIAAREFETAEVVVGKFSIKGEELKGEYTTLATDDNMIAIRHAGRAVLVLANPIDFFGEVKAKDADPTEPELPLDEQFETAGEQEADTWVYDWAAGTKLSETTGEVLPVGDEDLTPELQEAKRKFDEANAAAAARPKRGRRKRAEAGSLEELGEQIDAAVGERGEGTSGRPDPMWSEEPEMPAAPSRPLDPA